MSFLVLDGLSKQYGAAIAVDNLSLSIDRGEFLSLLGPSGCGKTTTLQMIAGFVEPTAGRITLDGADLLRVKPAKRGLGIVFQSYALFPHMTVGANVAFGLEMRTVARDERARRVAEALDLVGLSGFAERFPRSLSGGQQQRVALARALVIRPHVLLLDEPLSNLDAKLREDMQVELRQIQRAVGITTILVTHDQAEAMALSDRIVIMNEGRVEQIASPDRAYEAPASRFVATFLGKSNVLAGRVAEGRLAIGEGTWPSPCRVEGGSVAVTVRPEKIAFAENGLKGTVRNRLFLGSQWLFQIETCAGVVLVIRQNSGESVPAEHDRVALAWRAEDMQLAPQAAAET
jgi:putative spermidine/putrescine transport system ATP-binding protein